MSEFAIAEVTAGRLNALVKKIMQQTGVSDPNEAVRLVNSGEWIISKPTYPPWYEENGIIYFSVTSEGVSGKNWIERLKSKGFDVDDCAKEILNSPDFAVTSGVTTKVAILKDFGENDRTTNKIRFKADEGKLFKPRAELACLIRDKFTDKTIKSMGLITVVVMHKPINDFDNFPSLLSVHCGHNGRLLEALSGRSDHQWYPATGFAFAVSEVSPTV